MSASGWVNGFDPVDERPDMMESVAFKRNAPLPCKSPSGLARTRALELWVRRTCASGSGELVGERVGEVATTKNQWDDIVLVSTQYD